MREDRPALYTLENLGFSSRSGNNMTSRHGRDMIANLKAGLAVIGARGHEEFVMWLGEGIEGSLIFRHEVEECFAWKFRVMARKG